MILFLLTVLTLVSEPDVPSPSDIIQAELFIFSNSEDVDTTLVLKADEYKLKKALIYVAKREQLMHSDEDFYMRYNPFFLITQLKHTYQYTFTSALPRLPEKDWPNLATARNNYNKCLTVLKELITKYTWEYDRADLIDAAINDMNVRVKIWYAIYCQNLSNVSITMIAKREHVKFLQKYLGENLDKEIPEPVPAYIEEYLRIK